MISFPNAKINIGLYITDKRADGYHNIESIFYPIAWQDALEALPSEKLSFESSGLEIPGKPENNLILKAFHLLKDSLGGHAAKFHLHKVIPMGAGLGGGSADGAFTLKLLNELFELGLANEILKNLAAELGSDCPFFIENKPVFCYDRGIRFKEISLDLSSYYIVVINPSIHISTAEAYASITPQKAKVNLMEVIKQPLSQWKGQIENDFEKPLSVKYPLIAELKENLYQNGATYASMTGSGSTVYGIFENEPDLKNQFDDYTVWKGKML